MPAVARRPLAPPGGATRRRRGRRRDDPHGGGPDAVGFARWRSVGMTRVLWMALQRCHDRGRFVGSCRGVSDHRRMATEIRHSARTSDTLALTAARARLRRRTPARPSASSACAGAASRGSASSRPSAQVLARAARARRAVDRGDAGPRGVRRTCGGRPRGSCRRDRARRRRSSRGGTAGARRARRCRCRARASAVAWNARRPRGRRRAARHGGDRRRGGLRKQEVRNVRAHPDDAGSPLHDHLVAQRRERLLVEALLRAASATCGLMWSIVAPA